MSPPVLQRRGLVAADDDLLALDVFEGGDAPSRTTTSGSGHDSVTAVFT
jgi:hypothetical protein